MDHEHILDATELRLGLPGTAVSTGARGNKRASDEMDDNCSSNRGETKIQVVGWPPVRSYGRRKTSTRTRKAEQQDGEDGGTGPGIYVKVSMDGAPYLRKIDLKVYKGYTQLRVALEDMFNNSFSMGEYVITFQDKDGDWMMVGDVPFQMFFSTCKRLRIMKGCEAKGLTSTT